MQSDHINKAPSADIIVGSAREFIHKFFSRGHVLYLAMGVWKMKVNHAVKSSRALTSDKSERHPCLTRVRLSAELYLGQRQGEVLAFHPHCFPFRQQSAHKEASGARFIP